jgi:hypothetical protein
MVRSLRAGQPRLRWRGYFSGFVWEGNLQGQRHDFGPIKAGQQATWNGTVNYNQFVEAQQRFRAAELRDMKVVWVPASIIFADGTRIGERSERD